MKRTAARVVLIGFVFALLNLTLYAFYEETLWAMWALSFAAIGGISIPWAWKNF